MDRGVDESLGGWIVGWMDRGVVGSWCGWIVGLMDRGMKDFEDVGFPTSPKILHISYKDHVTNEEVHAKIQHAIGPHVDLLNIVKRRKLQWYGLVCRSLALAKTILQGTVKRGRRQGRQRKRWKDTFREWTGLEFAKAQRAMENREEWRKLNVKSSVVSRRSSRLRDR